MMWLASLTRSRMLQIPERSARLPSVRRPRTFVRKECKIGSHGLQKVHETLGLWLQTANTTKPLSVCRQTEARVRSSNAPILS